MDPQTFDDYQQRVNLNMQVTGYGAEVVTHVPCPWCGAADWMLLPITDPRAGMQDNITCRECERTGRWLFTVIEGGEDFELVQTGGPDAPGWLSPAPRRVTVG